MGCEQARDGMQKTWMKITRMMFLMLSSTFIFDSRALYFSSVDGFYAPPIVHYGGEGEKQKALHIQKHSASV